MKSQRPYDLSYYETIHLARHLNMLLASDIVERSSSAYNSPVLMVLKGNPIQYLSKEELPETASISLSKSSVKELVLKKTAGDMSKVTDEWKDATRSKRLFQKGKDPSGDRKCRCDGTQNCQCFQEDSETEDTGAPETDQLTGATAECDSEDEESDIRKGSFKQRGEQYGPHDLFPPDAENETPGEWVESASEAISAFVNDPAFTFSKVSRFCLDCREINSVCIQTHFWPETVSKLVHGMEQMQVACKLDLRQAFHNLVLAEDSRDFTSFQCAFGKFRYKRVAMGFVNASHTLCEFLAHTPWHTALRHNLL